ncbi:MAG: DNA mismatch repair protein MutS [Cellvibrionaceae bacterium]|jgi:DNA mismatch repair protein MutS
MSQGKLTPSRKQYLDMKTEYSEEILFFRMGDFYECFDEDAETIARELDLVLTARHQKGDKIPMAGVPHHAAENYIARLVAKGFRVALCEQTSAVPINGLMPRAVVRVFTAGTVIEEGMLDAGRNNYLAAVIIEDGKAGLAYADITTGEFATTTLPNRRALVEEIARLEPSELVLGDGEFSLNDGSILVRAISRIPDWRFEIGNARITLERHFGVTSLDAFGCENKPLAIRAAGAALFYLQETQKGAITQIQRLSTFQVDGYMALGLTTRRNLELTESLSGEKKNSLFGVLNQTVTPMGARLLRDRVTRPLLNIDQLNQRLDQVQGFFNDGLFRAELRGVLKGMADLERLTNKVVSGRANPRDVEQILKALEVIPDIEHLANNLFGGDDKMVATVQALISSLDGCEDVCDLIGRAIQPDAPSNTSKSGFVAAGFAPELDGVVNASAHARTWVSDLEPREKERTGINALKVGFNKVFGYYIEITRANSHLAPDDYIRKQTLTNAERYITPELKEYETLILNAEDRMLEIERRLFIEICQEVSRYAERLLATAQTIAQLDVAAGLAETAANQGYTRPEINEGDGITITAGRHPVIERSLNLERFVPNNTLFSSDERIQLITGPNMAGKSTILRQVALIALMAQMGSFVPAESAEIGLVDRIFTRIGAHDELHAGRSTFMVEMVEAAEILNHATHRSLLILDEIGRGTSTYDGLSIAWAIIEYLHNHPRLKPRTLFATHYHELTGLADLLPHVVNYNIAVAEEGENIVFLHELVRGWAERSFGIHVAQLAGMPRDVVQRAKEILKDLEEHAVTTSVEPSHLKPAQQAALFPEASPILDELNELDITTMTPLEAINKLYEWKKKFG